MKNKIRQAKDNVNFRCHSMKCLAALRCLIIRSLAASSVSDLMLRALYKAEETICLR